MTKNSLSKMQKAWSSYKKQLLSNGSKSILNIYLEENDEAAGDGEKVLLLAAVYELRIIQVAMQLHVASKAGEELRSNVNNAAKLEIEFRHQYDKFGQDEKWALVPLFFDLKANRRASPYLEDIHGRKFFDNYVKLLKRDGLDLTNVKQQFLTSGYNQLIPILNQLDPDLVGLKQTTEKPTKSAPPKSEPRSTQSATNVEPAGSPKADKHGFRLRSKSTETAFVKLKFTKIAALVSQLSFPVIATGFAAACYYGYLLSLKIEVVSDLHEATRINLFSIYQALWWFFYLAGVGFLHGLIREILNFRLEGTTPAPEAVNFVMIFVVGVGLIPAALQLSGILENVSNHLVIIGASFSLGFGANFVLFNFFQENEN